MAKPRIYIAYTGGTIGMHKTEQGYKPKRGWLQKLIGDIPQFFQDKVPDFDICQYDPLLDSSNMTPADWLKIASDLQARKDQYDGFLVIHGTDTMAFTASALSFMLLGFGKPVLLTGSQIPLEETRNDAHDNLLTALIILGRFHETLNEVCIYFDNMLLRGNRATKVNADGFAALASPNLPPLATIGVHIAMGGATATGNLGVTLNRSRLLDAPDAAAPLFSIGQAVVTAFDLFPGLQASQVRALISPPVQGVAMSCFGAGNAPSKNTKFMAALRDATDQGVVIADITQPLVGSADLNLYATGRALQAAGVISGYDMTREACLTKLLFLIDMGIPPELVKTFMEVPLAGELTRPPGAPAPPVDLDELFAAATVPSVEPKPVREDDRLQPGRHN